MGLRPRKRAHVNVRAGENKFAVLYPEGDYMRDQITEPGPYFDVIRDQNSFVGERGRPGFGILCQRTRFVLLLKVCSPRHRVASYG